jgi:pyruvate,water dikinase
VVHVLAADDSPRWQALRGGDASTTWVELDLGGRAPEPPTRLSQSILERTVRGSLEALLRQLRCPVSDDVPLVSSWAGRSYLNLNALLEVTRNVPLLSPEDVLAAVGGVGPDARRALAGRAASRGRSMWRAPLVGVTALREQVGLEREVASLERAIERDARGLDDMDLAILPSDAMGVTLASAQALLERTGELWIECAASQLAHALGLRGILRRRLPDADPRIGYALMAGSGRSFGATMTAELARVVEVFRRDAASAARLDDPAVKRAADLPDGAARGALGQFLGRYGEACIGAVELSTPRWREDARELMRMVSLVGRHPPAARVETMQQEARAAADAQLGRYEAELNLLERRLLRALLDRGRRLAEGRATVDRLVFRALAMVRRVVLDIGRRLSRVDHVLGEADGDEVGAFHCSAERLAGALKSGRPELTRTIRMRRVERWHQSQEPAPPHCFVGSPPRGAIPVVSASVLEGLGVSPGVVEGRVRIAQRMLPDDLEPGDILVTSSLDVALVPLCLLATGIISETGGDLSLGVEAVRDLGVPTVTSVPSACLRLEDRERVRLDGSSGRIQRLDHELDVPRREPIPHGEQAVP